MSNKFRAPLQKIVIFRCILTMQTSYNSPISLAVEILSQNNLQQKVLTVKNVEKAKKKYKEYKKFEFFHQLPHFTSE